jgi:Amt family ammonium transporter
MPPHNLPLVATGAGMLWVGWFGFNGGSALAANGTAAMAILATHLGACAGALAWMLIEWRQYGKPSVLGVVTGVVAGLGTITPASGFVSPVGAVAIGFIAGTVCFFATQLLKRVLHIDDSLDVSPVHGVGGITGSLLVAVFAGTALGGTGYSVQSGMGQQLGVQALGIAVTALWCGSVTWALLKVLDATLGLRVSEEAESEGLDLSEHGERGYGP